MNTLRAVIFSTKLFFRDINRLFMLNVRNSLNQLKLLQKRKALNNTESKKEQTEPTEKKEKIDEKETKKYDEFFVYDYEQGKILVNLSQFLKFKFIESFNNLEICLNY
jgi:hypothetical protein